MNIKKMGWRFINSLWIVFAFIVLLNWIAFIFIGSRTKNRKWMLFSVIYFAITAVFVVSSGTNSETVKFWTGIYLLSWLACIVHAFLDRKEYLLKLEQMNANNSNNTQEPPKTDILAVNVTDHGAVAMGFKKVERIRSLTVQMKECKIKAKLEDLIGQATKILTELQKNPDDIIKAKKFLNYYLDATQNIVEKYIKLNEQIHNNSDFIQVEKKVEDILDEIGIAFQKQMHKLLEDDLLDLEVEMSLLDKTIKAEQIL